jgi:hypothetical protein
MNTHIDHLASAARPNLLPLYNIRQWNPPTKFRVAGDANVFIHQTLVSFLHLPHHAVA